MSLRELWFSYLFNCIYWLSIYLLLVHFSRFTSFTPPGDLFHALKKKRMSLFFSNCRHSFNFSLIHIMKCTVFKGRVALHENLDKNPFSLTGGKVLSFENQSYVSILYYYQLDLKHFSWLSWICWFHTTVFTGNFTSFYSWDLLLLA